MDYDKPYFAFGKDHFNSEDSKDHFAVNFSNSAFNFITDEYYYLFNEKDVLVKTDYRKDPLGRNNLISKKTPKDDENIKRFKAFVQEYYTHVSQRDYLPEPDKSKKLAMNSVKPIRKK